MAAARVGELKKELRRLVRAIAEEDDSRIEKFEGAARALAALKDLRFRGSGNSNGALASQRKAESEIEAVVVPEHFLCPISAELMRDPVVVASGQVRYLTPESSGSLRSDCIEFVSDAEMLLSHEFLV